MVVLIIIIYFFKIVCGTLYLILKIICECASGQNDELMPMGFFLNSVSIYNSQSQASSRTKTSTCSLHLKRHQNDPYKWVCILFISPHRDLLACGLKGGTHVGEEEDGELFITIWTLD